jgi:thioredoxin 1
MASNNILELTAANWENEVVKSDKPVLVDFWAPWCMPCRALLPTIEKVAEQFADKIKVGKVNIDDEQDIAVRYRVSGLPVVMMFKGGDQPVDKTVGNLPLANFVQMVNRVLES